MTPGISLILCTRNHAAALAKTLEALAQVTTPDNQPIELLLVDNGSTDTTRQVASAASPKLQEAGRITLRYIPEPRPGQCHARNAGLAAAKGEVVVFTDDDVRPAHDWLEMLSRPILSGSADATVGTVTLAPHLLRPWMAPMHRSWLAATEEVSAEQPRLVGACMAFHRRVLQQVPAFDTELGPGALGFGDDTLFSEQLVRAGFRIVSISEACVEHHCDEDRLQRHVLLATAAKQGRSQAYVTHHWEHGGISLPVVREWKNRMLLALRQRGKGRKADEEGVSVEELLQVSYMHFYRHFAHERRRARLYERHGLIKKAS